MYPIAALLCQSDTMFVVKKSLYGEAALRSKPLPCHIFEIPPIGNDTPFTYLQKKHSDLLSFFVRSVRDILKGPLKYLIKNSSFSYSFLYFGL